MRAFTEMHRETNDEAILGLLDAYDRQTQYRYSAESGHLIAELRTLDADVIAIAKINTQLMELFCRLVATDYQALATYMEYLTKRA